MKHIIAIATICLLSLTSACNKTRQCETDNPICTERPPTDELCQAYFVRWFYNASTNSCEEIGYSGCSVRGFASEADCEACVCD